MKSKSIILFSSLLIGLCTPLLASPENEPAPVTSIVTSSEQRQQEVIFTPPPGWRLADKSTLPPAVRIMVVGKGTHDFPPSIHLGTDRYDGSLKDYLKLVKSINDARGSQWVDLGTIKTEAGDASLSQLDAKTKWGEVHYLQTILIKDGTVFILTAAAAKDEFSKFYNDFFKSMQSFRFGKELS